MTCGVVTLPRFVRRHLAALAVLASVVAGPEAAFGSEKITDNASDVTLRVDRGGRAVVSYTRAGRRTHAVVWGAVNARHPSRTVPQVEFKVDYSGGYAKLGFPLWKTIRNVCGRYQGPRLPWLVTACTAPDGSHWAVQQFRRLLPNLGLAPWNARQRARELHVSHWKGPTAKLAVYADWVMSARRHEVFGTLTYRGRPVHGFASTRSGAPLDGYGRLIYLDTLNSALGRGWKRENSFLAQRPFGRWCYLFVPRDRYAGYPPGPRRPAANGERYRLTGGGPGVTPLVMATIAGLPDFNRRNAAHLEREARVNAVKRALFGDRCFGS